jgi:hypothetical protein
VEDKEIADADDPEDCVYVANDPGFVNYMPEFISLLDQFFDPLRHTVFDDVDPTNFTEYQHSTPAGYTDLTSEKIRSPIPAPQVNPKLPNARLITRRKKTGPVLDAVLNLGSEINHDYLSLYDPPHSFGFVDASTTLRYDKALRILTFDLVVSGEHTMECKGEFNTGSDNIMTLVFLQTPITIERATQLVHTIMKHVCRFSFHLHPALHEIRVYRMHTWVNTMLECVGTIFSDTGKFFVVRRAALVQ